MRSNATFKPNDRVSGFTPPHYQVRADTSNFVECCFINLNELYQLSERGIVGKGSFDDLNEWSFFYV